MEQEEKAVEEKVTKKKKVSKKKVSKKSSPSEPKGEPKLVKVLPNGVKVFKA